MSTGNTPNLALPYPNPDEPVANLDLRIKDLATALDNAQGAPWTPYTPVLTNIAVGATGSARGRSRLVGKSCSVRIALLGGTSGATGNGGAIAVGLPVASHGIDNQILLVRVFTGAALLTGWADIAPGATKATVYVANGANGAMNTLGAFANGGSLFVQGTYETA